MTVHNQVTGRPVFQDAERFVQPSECDTAISEEIIEFLEERAQRFQALDVLSPRRKRDHIPITSPLFALSSELRRVLAPRRIPKTSSA